MTLKDKDDVVARLLRHGRRWLRSGETPLFVPSAGASTSNGQLAASLPPTNLSQSEQNPAATTETRKTSAPEPMQHSRTPPPRPVHLPRIARSNESSPMNNGGGGAIIGREMDSLRVGGLCSPAPSTSATTPISILRAQELALLDARKKLDTMKDELEKVEWDVQAVEEYLNADFPGEEISKESISRLENEIVSLNRRRNELRPYVPVVAARGNRDEPHTGANEWMCVRCTFDNPLDDPEHGYRCGTCLMPRPVIPPSEAARCGCVHCAETVGTQ